MESVKDHIRRTLLTEGTISAGRVAEAMAISRQAAHYHLRQMVQGGELRPEGAGRGRRYVLAADFVHRYPRAGLEEHRVWQEVEASVPAIQNAKENVRSILSYGFTEMVNNAIEHSAAMEVVVTVWLRSGSVAFAVADNGVGVYRHLRERTGLPDDFAALEELLKGKQTTDPQRHSGEGIFFTSRLADRFELESRGLRWVVDNLRNDQAIGEGSDRRGTRVYCDVAQDTERTTTEVFERHADAETFAFTRSSVPVRLFAIGERFVSRSEARRLANRLEAFEQVELDFAGVREVGQGFVDELFRVWARDHPGTRLVPINMVPPIERMIRRVSGSQAPGT